MKQQTDKKIKNIFPSKCPKSRGRLPIGRRLTTCPTGLSWQEPLENLACYLFAALADFADRPYTRRTARLARAALNQLGCLKQ